MSTIEKEPRIYQAMIDALSEAEVITKGRKNPQQGYSFRGIDDIYNAMHSILAKHRLFTTSEILNVERFEWETKNGGRMTEYALLIRWKFQTVDGSSVTTETVGQAMDSGDKAANKAMSAAHKYAFLQAFTIPTEGDNDIEAYSPEPARRAEPARQAAAMRPAAQKAATLSEKQEKFIRDLIKSHVFTDEERRRVSLKLDEKTADGKAIIDWLQKEKIARQEVLDGEQVREA
ncbi:MAG: ERF family protein [Chlorobiaceae bacterium]